MPGECKEEKCNRYHTSYEKVTFSIFLADLTEIYLFAVIYSKTCFPKKNETWSESLKDPPPRRFVER